LNVELANKINQEIIKMIKSRRLHNKTQPLLKMF